MVRSNMFGADCNHSAGHLLSHSSWTNPLYRILEEAIFTAEVLVAQYGYVVSILLTVRYGQGWRHNVMVEEGKISLVSSMAEWWALDEGDKFAEGGPSGIHCTWTPSFLPRLHASSSCIQIQLHCWLGDRCVPQVLQRWESLRQMTCSSKHLARYCRATTGPLSFHFDAGRSDT